jgi:hypothetical protein
VLAALDWLLTIVHVAVVLAFVFLWIPRKASRWHGWLVAFTAFSWLGLGYFMGFGYCFLTDLQWRVKRARGVARLPGSFLKYLADYVTGTSVPVGYVNAIAGVVFALGCGAALFRYWQSRRA